MKYLTIMALSCLILLTGCIPHSANTYNFSTSNIDSLKGQFKNTKPIAIDTFTATTPGVKAILCRLAGNVRLPNNQSYEQYIQNALTQELSAMGLYDPNAATRLKGNVDYVDFNSTADFWSIQMTFYSDKTGSFTVTDRYFYHINGFSNFLADTACHYAASHFQPAVQDFLGKLYQDPHFKKLVS